MRGNMFFVMLWMLCLDCSASSFLPKVHSAEMMPLDVKDGAYDDFKTLVTKGDISLTEQDNPNFLEYARIKNVNIEEKINYYLNYISNIRNVFFKSKSKNFEDLINIANGLLYDQGRYDTLKKRIERHLNADHPPLADQDRLYCQNLIIVLDCLMNKSCDLLCDIKKKLPLGGRTLNSQYYKLHKWNIFDFVEDTLPFKRKLNICALM